MKPVYFSSYFANEVFVLPPHYTHPTYFALLAIHLAEKLARSRTGKLARLSQGLCTQYDVGADSQELNFKLIYLLLKSIGSTEPTS